MSISTRTGTEGPRHDPYSFTEITVEARGHRVTVHYGLGEWIEVDGTGERLMALPDASCVMEALTGLTLAQAERALRKRDESYYRRHKAHGGYEWSSGYPGEELCFCKCGQCIDSTFNESAII
jgi:hypothetical protein